MFIHFSLWHDHSSNQFVEEIFLLCFPYELSCVCKCDGVWAQSSGRVSTLWVWTVPLWSPEHMPLLQSQQSYPLIKALRRVSAGCCGVFTLFVVLNLIVINILDRVCTWQAYQRTWFVWLVLHFQTWYLKSLYLLLPCSKQYFKKAESTVLLYWCWKRFCVDNQWSFRLKSQTNKGYLRWRERCKESIV